MPVKACCTICGRPLDVETDPFSVDCGGDCLGCMIEIEDDVVVPDGLLADEARAWLDAHRQAHPRTYGD